MSTRSKCHSLTINFICEGIHEIMSCYKVERFLMSVIAYLFCNMLLRDICCVGSRRGHQRAQRTLVRLFFQVGRGTTYIFQCDVFMICIKLFHSIVYTVGLITSQSYVISVFFLSTV